MAIYLQDLFQKGSEHEKALDHALKQGVAGALSYNGTYARRPLLYWSFCWHWTD